ncbi:putative glutamine amidotransferase [Rubrobacter radiotolerans]|uniref:Gamma-glutamyl-gamma-aminobutyrate hydrolase family protein n=1 Tax=Rubrobacter radiotolerans TaxID=42256 RepID=A0A023X6T2_RUBRA|nr:gamma-glutamyl-gamma-aminobutyrate hydrolase family protein [Rubrobacter radiotolerans]AHY48033.1 putative glutamine amidotransferase [Rubrobacter radiotolerans]MDX5892672.1 gamma-glutamyl-gamma-aminobutyrate hydrolase family protein [Rubrobacter radiotolerans]SMC08073.1 putative glutamine amidotransferase [Rubrobacter radiotolerans DSM 5868]
MNGGRTGRPADRPTVGITAAVETISYGPWRDVQAAITSLAYTEAVLRAGGRPVLLVPNRPDAENPEEALASLDALIISGGAGDLDPALYGEEPHPETKSVNPERDAYELALVRAAREAGLPTLGVCRGMQVVNLAYGGTLHQHLPDVVGHEKHRKRGTFTDHEVSVSEGSLAARATGADSGTEAVKSCHHQGVREVGEGLEATARATLDSVVEAVEDASHPFMLGVLWHPEEDERSRLIGSLVKSTQNSTREV